MLTSPQVLASGKIRGLLAEMRLSQIWKQIVEPRDQVFTRFQPVFATAHLPKLTEDEFKPFLNFSENHHWTGLHRQGPRLCGDMPKLRKILGMLLDETRPIQARLDEVAGSIKGFGEATITAILHVAHPTKYGVLNSTSEGALVTLGIYPKFERGEKFGSRYAKFNTILNDLARSVDCDLWTLDAVWWLLEEGDVTPGGPSTSTPVETLAGVAEVSIGASAMVFGLERHLHDFLFENWDKLDIGREWAVYSTPAKEDAGYEFACSVGRMDILAKHRTHNKWLVVELKRNDTSDAVVGQVLRYMGWIKKWLADPTDEVHGIIIAQEGDESLHYAVSTVPNLTFQVYEVEFRLKNPPPVTDEQ